MQPMGHVVPNHSAGQPGRRGKLFGQPRFKRKNPALENVMGEFRIAELIFC